MTRAVVTGFVMAGTVVLPATAQGGLLRRAKEKVTATVETTIGGGSEKAEGATSGATNPQPATTAAAPTTTHPALLTMDADVMDRFGRALTAEIGTRDAWVAFEQEFATCQSTMYTDPAMLDDLSRMSDEMARAMENAKTPDDLVALSLAHQARLDALVKRHCGISNTEFSERQSGINEQVQQAALAAGNFTDAQYGLLKERIVPFCKAGGTSASIPGPQGDHFYVYSADEVAAIAPRCASLMPQVERTI